MANVFALLGMRALFVLVEGLIKRFRYLDQTIAIVLAVVAIKLLIEDLYKVGPAASLAIVAVVFTVGHRRLRASPTAAIRRPPSTRPIDYPGQDSSSGSSVSSSSSSSSSTASSPDSPRPPAGS